MVAETPSLRPIELDADTNVALGQIVAELSYCRRETSKLSARIGEAPKEGVAGSGLAGTVARLEMVIGDSPDDATGSPGSGLCGVLAELVRVHRHSLASHLKTSAASAAGAIALLEVVRQVLHLFGG